MEPMTCLQWSFQNCTKEHLYLLDSDKISEYDKELARQLIQGVASAKDIKSSLLFLTRLMQQYYGKKDSSSYR